MNSIVKRISAFAAVAILALSTLAVTRVVQAQDAGSGLRISPTRNELSIVSGDSREIVQTVKNVTGNPVTVEPVLTDFESDGTSGEPRLLGREDEVSAYSLREFIDLPTSFDLAPDEEKEVTISLNVSENASPGAYFGSVLYRASPQGEAGDGQVSLVASVGSLVLLEVPGEITEKIQINDISAYIGENAGSLFTKKPETVGIEVQNLGNSFAQPFGKVLVENWGGSKIFEYELNNARPRGNVLPESTRLFQNELANVEVRTVNGEEEVIRNSPITWPGRYTITGNISHGASGEIFTVSSTFWYIPSWLIVLIVIVLIGLVGGAVYLYRKYATRSTRRK